MLKLPALFSAVVEDAVSAIAHQGASLPAYVAGEALSKMMGRRFEAARERLLDELKAGTETIRDVSEVEEIVAILYRYLRAAQEGSGRVNLRLMAQAIAGQAHEGNLVADQFLYYADILATLRREEVILLGTMLRLFHGSRDDQGYHGANLMHLWQAASERLVPALFPDNDHMRATAGAIGRTGLLMTEATLDATGYWLPSPLLAELVRLTSFDDALRKEGLHE